MSQIWIRLKRQVIVSPGEPVRLGEVAEIAGADEYKEQLLKIEVGRAGRRSYNISALEIVSAVKEEFPEAELCVLGSDSTVVRVLDPSARAPLPLALAVTLLLFIGSAMAIMNFHADVNMPQVHRNVYLLLTGNRVDNPLVLNIPYSLGIGIGIALFFGHIRWRYSTAEPSPLEVEMYLYEQNVDRCVSGKTEGGQGSGV